MSRRNACGCSFCVFLIYIGFFSALSSSVSNLSTPLNEVPMIMAHDAGSGYLLDGSEWPDESEWPHTLRNLILGWTKTQSGGLGTQLDCGARAFDARPYLKQQKNGSTALVWHHGSIIVPHRFDASLAEVLDWCEENPDELVLMTIWDCVGDVDGCMDNVSSVLTEAGVSPIDDCNEFANLTLGEALNRSQVSGGGRSGHLLVVTAPALPGGEAACSYANYKPDNGCSGVLDRADTSAGTGVASPLERANNTETAAHDTTAAVVLAAVLQCFADAHPGVSASLPTSHFPLAMWRTLSRCMERSNATSSVASAAAKSAYEEVSGASESEVVYRCYDGDPRQGYPLDRLFDYLDATSLTMPPTDDPTAPLSPDGTGRQLWQMQALWQETAESVVLGTLRRSSLLDDEIRSGLNAKLAAAVSSGRWQGSGISLLEVNNVCDGGAQLYGALKAMYNRSKAAAP